MNAKPLGPCKTVRSNIYTIYTYPPVIYDTINYRPNKCPDKLSFDCFI